jgi:hypothetical protein
MIVVKPEAAVSVSKNELELSQHEASHHESLQRESDLLSQFRANLNQIEELQGRVNFMVGEIRTLIQKKKSL